MSTTNDATTYLYAKVKLSMVSLKTGDVLSTLIPGSVFLYAVFPHIPFLATLFADLNKASAVTGFVLLIAAVILGGILEAITRILWEPCWLLKRAMPPSVAAKLKENPHNLELYERTVQSSYKYVTFYANLAWAVAVLFVSRFYEAQYWFLSLILALGTMGILLRASHLQWTYYVANIKRIFGDE